MTIKAKWNGAYEASKDWNLDPEENSSTKYVVYDFRIVGGGGGDCNPRTYYSCRWIRVTFNTFLASDQMHSFCYISHFK